MRKRQWTVTLTALGLMGFAVAASNAQAPSPSVANPVPPAFPYHLPAAPPSPVRAPSTPVLVSPGPQLPGLPVALPTPTTPSASLPVPVATAPRPVSQSRTGGFADLSPSVLMPAQGTTPVLPGTTLMMPSGTVVSPTPSTPVGSSPGSTLLDPAPSGTMSGAVVGSSPVPASDAPQVKFSFKPGDEHLLNMDYGNGLFKFYVGGRLQLDGVWYRGNDALTAPRVDGGIGRLDDAVNFRRARFDFGGTFYKNIDFLMEWDFINSANAERIGNPLAVNTPVPTDMWVTFKEIPWIGNLRIGNQKPPISFEHMTSSRFLNFMERSLGFDAFIENQNNGFEFGACAFDNFMDEHGLWAIGVFKNTRNIFGWNVGDGEYDLTGRVTFLPIYEDDGAVLVHVGLGASHRDFDDDVDRVRARTLLRNGPAVLHTIVAEAIMGGASRDLVNPEFVVVYGPWTFQSEYQRGWFREATIPATGPGERLHLGTIQLQAAYAELLYFLTGEHRYYNRKTAAFGRVTPNQNFTGFGMTEDGCDGCDPCGGTGAWQIGARYSWIDMDNNGIAGGTVHDVTLGLNWFLNPYMKWQWNLEALYRNAPNSAHDGWAYGFGTRIALDF